MAVIAPLVGYVAGGIIAPGAIGFLGLTGAGAGLLAGNLVASLLAPTQKVQGPRLSDLKVTASSFGSPIPYIVGHHRVGGQVVWASDKREIPTTTKSGKGGPKVQTTNYTYEVDLLIQLSSNRMAGVRKIFYNGELVWTAATESNLASINASTEFARAVRVHTGDPGQLADPVYEAAVGIGNAPAFRGSLTVGIEALQLGNSGQIGNLTFEVMQTTTPAVGSQTINTRSMSFQHVTGYSDASRTVVWTSDVINDPSRIRWFSVSPQGQTYDEGTKVFGENLTLYDGNMDRPLLVAFGYSNVAVYVDEMDGSQAKAFVVSGAWGAPAHFSIVGQTLAVITSGGYLARYEMLSSLDALALTTTSGVNGVVVRDDRIYTLSAPNASVHTIYVYNRETLAFIESYSTPALGQGAARIIQDEIGEFLWVNETQVWRRDDGAWTKLLDVPSGFGSYLATGDIPSYNSSPYYVGSILYTTRFSSGTGLVRAAWPSVTTSDRLLSDVVQEVCARVDIGAGALSLAGIAGKTIKGMAISPSTTRQVLEMLSSAYFFEWSGLKAIARGGAAVAAIPWVDLGSTRDGEAPGDPAILQVANDIEKPAYVHIKYINGDNDYQDDLQSSDRLATESDGVQLLELPIVFSATEVKRLAMCTAADLQASLITIGPIKLQRQYDFIEPGDVFTLTLADGSVLRMRAQQKTREAALVSITAVIDDASVVTSDAVTDTDYTSSTTVKSLPLSLPQPLDLPLLRDADNNAGLYVAIDSIGTPAPGATLFVGQDQASYEARGQTTDEAPVGTVESTLADWPYNVIDNINTFIVNVGDAVLSNATRDAVYNQGANAWAIGQPGRWEVGQSLSFSSLGGGRYLVSGHLRGRRGTDHNTGNHQAGDVFVLLNPAGMVRPIFDVAELNQNRYFMAVTAGRTSTGALEKTGVNTGEGLKPFSPVFVRKAKAANNDQTVSWDWRTRFSGEFPNGAEIPFSETIVGYEIDLYTSSAFTTKAGPTLTSTTNSRTITAAEQTAAGLTPGNTLYVRVFQLSALVGRGNYRQAVL